MNGTRYPLFPLKRESGRCKDSGKMECYYPGAVSERNTAGPR